MWDWETLYYDRDFYVYQCSIEGFKYIDFVYDNIKLRNKLWNSFCKNYHIFLQIHRKSGWWCDEVKGIPQAKCLGA